MWFDGWYDGSISGRVHPNSLLPRVVTEAELRRHKMIRASSQRSYRSEEGPSTSLPLPPRRPATASAAPVEAEPAVPPAAAEPDPLPPTPAVPGVQSSHPRRRDIPHYFVAAGGDLPNMYHQQ